MDEDESPFHWIEGDSLAPPCQTDREVIASILTLVEPYVDESSTLFDLGCGDGRICIAASTRFGCKSVGVEIEEVLVDRFRAALAASTVAHLVSIIQGDLLQVDLSSATVIVLYLLPEAIVLIADQLAAALARGAVLVCNTWGPKAFKAVRTLDCGEALNVRLHLYTKDSLPAAEGH